MRRNPRLFLPGETWPPAVGQYLTLSTEQQHYLVHVLRLKKNSEVDVFIGQGKQLLAALDLVQRTLRVEKVLQSPVVARPSLTLFQGLLKNDKFDWVVEKATELGVDRIIPVICQHSIPVLDEKRTRDRVTRWREIATMASQQSLRSAVPEVALPVVWTQLPWENGPRSTGFVLWEKVDPQLGFLQGLQQQFGHQGSYAVLVGPEGGFSDEEIACFTSRRWISCSLGPRILRAETAALAAVTLLSSVLDGT